MKGLLIKDLRLLFGQTRFFIVVSLFGICFMITNENPISGMSYITMLFSIFTLSTISYDEYDNGMAFLMTLPIDRKIYAKEKYVFAIGITLISAVISSIIAITIAKMMSISVSVKELLVTGIVVIALVSLILAISIPIEIKFGAEKGRIAMILVTGMLIGIGALIVKGSDFLGINLIEWIGKILQLDKIILSIIGFILWCVIMSLSYCICVNILKKKQF